MPKLIDNAREAIIKAAEEELHKKEGADFSMRKIAKKCNMAVGTLYNYFPDKFTLVETILKEEWMDEYHKASLKISSQNRIEDILLTISSLIQDFRKRNQSVFTSYKGEGFGSYYIRLHFSFVRQIEELWKIGTSSYHFSEEENLMISEMILIQFRDEKISFQTLCSMIKDLSEVKHESEL